MKSNEVRFLILATAVVLLFAVMVPASAQIVQSGNTIVDLAQAERCNPPIIGIGTDVELLDNNGFETGDFPPWYHDGYWSVVTTTPHTGTYCAYDIGNHWLRQDVTPTPASDIVSATVWCKQPESAIAAIDFFYTNGTYSEDLIWPTADWQMFDVTGFITAGLTVNGFRVWGYSGGGPDPDETFYDDLSIETAGGPPPDVTIFLDPYGSTTIPATGGTLTFLIGVTNNEPGPATFDVWTNVTLPSGTIFGPLIGPVNLTLGAGATVDRDRTQDVPAGAPPGMYTYNAYAGYHPDQIASEAHFDFEKLATGDGGVTIGDWSTFGDLFEGEMPGEFALLGNYPNPFNPATTIEFSLNKADFVELSVFDVSGRHVATLVDGFRDAGVHEVTFDATGLASGLYVYRLTSGVQTALGKMILIK